MSRVPDRPGAQAASTTTPVTQFRNPRSEIRNISKNQKNTVQTQAPQPGFERLNMSIWVLFRISDFGFRIYW